MNMNDLNPQQLEAVNHNDGPLLVLAGAGSGKTRVVTSRISRLIREGVLSSEILAVTFTNRAANEMKTRIHAQTHAHVLACTFHSLGARILRESIGVLGYRHDFVIYDEEDREKLLKNCLDHLGIGREASVVKETLIQISSTKNSFCENTTKEKNSSFDSVYQIYQSKLKECNALDFDDLLYLTAELLKHHPQVRALYQNRFRFVLIDEYQDTNPAQHLITQLLVETHKNLFAVGDPDQSIYSWRGARYQNILNFTQDFPGAKLVLLEQNYRSTNYILQAANHLIKNNLARSDKTLWSQLGSGEKIGLFSGYNERDEADFVVRTILNYTQAHSLSFEDVAIFYRTNAQSRAFEDALLGRRLPYTIIGGLSFYQRREVKDILSYLRMIVSDSDVVAFLRTINLPKRGFGSTTLEKIISLSHEKNQSILSLCHELSERCTGELKISAKQRDGLIAYLALIARFRSASPSLTISGLITEIIDSTNYLSYLKEDPETEQDRRGNIKELIAKAAEWEEEQETPSLQLFLEELSLKANIDTNQPIPSIRLMTLHNSKGLEFSLVCIGGLEEDLLPHVNSKDDLDAIEEERRLFYVGMTRAKRFLFLSHTHSRYLWNGPRFMVPSRFIKELPNDLLTTTKRINPSRYTQTT